ncbi:MAG: ABC transporter ATP-binding protein, partial [Cyanobacteriota bacterium]|nr:ABC transporter ATP-binding protein [Cyanobacteriota bacterium]
MQAGKKLKEKLQSTQRLLPALRLVWQSSPRWTIARVIILIIQGILPVVSIYLGKLIIDTVAAGLTATDKTAAFNNVIFIVILAAAATLLT